MFAAAEKVKITTPTTHSQLVDTEMLKLVR